MKRLMIPIASAMGIIVFLIGAWFAWQVFGPSVIVIRNVGNEPARFVLTDADQTAQVWSGELEPGRRKTVIVWFTGEGGPELRCRDQTSSGRAPLGYVSGYLTLNLEVEVAGCDKIVRIRRS